MQCVLTKASPEKAVPAVSAADAETLAAAIAAAVSVADAETLAAAIAAAVSVADAAEASATDNFTIKSLNLYIRVCLNGHTFFCF